MKLQQQLDERLIQRGYARSTRETYGHWVEKYFLHILKLHGRTVRPEKMTKDDVQQWLTDLAVKEHLAPTTQNVALQSVLFLYREILKIDFQGIDALRSQKPKLMPVVLNMAELGMMFDELKGIPQLIAKLQTGCGLRIGEVCSLRMKDLDFDREQMTVRHAKGAKDRVTIFPKELHDAVRSQIKSMDVLFSSDRRDGMPGVSMPFAYDRKSTSASTSWTWFYLFASGQLSKHPDTGKLGRHHLDPDHINRKFTDAARKVRLTKKLTSHAFRHTFATYMLSNGTDIMTLANMMGHNDIRTTQIYLHCNLNSGEMQRTPFGNLLAGRKEERVKPPLREMLQNPPEREPFAKAEKFIPRLFTGTDG
jgi:integron integrase